MKMFLRKGIALVLILTLLLCQIPGSVIADNPATIGRVRIESQYSIVVRAEPDRNSAKLGVADSGQEFDLLEASADGWYRIAMPDGTSGWVPGEYAVRLEIPVDDNAKTGKNNEDSNGNTASSDASQPAEATEIAADDASPEPEPEIESESMSEPEPEPEPEHEPEQEPTGPRVVLSEQKVTLAKGKSFKLTATPQDLGEGVKVKKTAWETSDSKIARVSGGNISGVAPGDAVITCRVTLTDNTELTAQCEVHVYLPVASLQPAERSLVVNVDQTKTLTVTVKPLEAEYPAITWTSSDPAVAAVDNKGRVTGVSTGRANIIGTLNEPGMPSQKTVKIPVTVNQGSKSLTLSESAVTVPKGKNVKLTATISPDSTTNKKVNWTSSNPNVATVANGTVVGKGTGTCTITAEAADGSGAKATCSVTVIQAVTSLKARNGNSIKIQVSDTRIAEVSVMPLDATNKTLSWVSSNSRIAEVDNRGRITANRAGDCVITAMTTDGSNMKVDFKVHVSNLLNLDEAYSMTYNLDTKDENQRGHMITCYSGYTPGSSFYMNCEFFFCDGLYHRYYDMYIKWRCTDAQTKSEIKPEFKITIGAMYGPEPNLIMLSIKNGNNYTIPKSICRYIGAGDIEIDFSNHLYMIDDLVRYGGCFTWSDIYPSSLCCLFVYKNTPEHKYLNSIWNIWKKAGLYDLFVK